MLQEAVVTGIREDGLAEVVVERLGICGGECSECNECQYENLMKSVVKNPIGAHKGQRVMIETPTAGVFAGALIIYVLPLVLLLVGYALASVFTASEGLLIGAALSGLCLGVFIAVILSRKKHAKNPTPTEIVEIVYSEE